MECDICRRGHNPQRLPFICAVDARNQAYEGRMKNLQALIENEALGKQISELVADKATPCADSLGADKSNQLAAETRTTQILDAASKLRDEIKAARDEVQARKAELARRRSDFATISDGQVTRRDKQQSHIEKSIQMQKYRWSQSAEDMAGTRGFLCAEAADLYGLRRTAKAEAKRTFEYYLGKVPVVDLMTMSSQSPEVITTSLGHIAHILQLASHYLAVRLPAEITIPHRDYPFATIFNLATSYRHGDLPFPGTAVANNAPADDPDAEEVSRPRPLYLHKPMPQLLKEDPAQHSFLLEGVTLLAYDIAWLCCSQGITIHEKGAFEEICQMGKNLYRLLIESQVPGNNNKSSAPSKDASLKNSGRAETVPSNWVGRYSHGTMFYDLGSAEGIDVVRSFKLPGPMKLADKLRRKLIGDTPAPDWEVLDDDAWKIEDVPTEDLTGELQSMKGSVTSNGTDYSQKQGSSNGWTKVK